MKCSKIVKYTKIVNESASMEYMDRYLDDELEQWMNVVGAVLIVGPKWSGKTTTAEQYAKSVLKLQDIDRQEEYQMWLDIRLQNY